MKFNVAAKKKNFMGKILHSEQTIPQILSTCEIWYKFINQTEKYNFFYKISGFKIAIVAT